MVRSLWKAVPQFLKKSKVGLQQNPAIPPRGIYSKEMKAGTRRDRCTLVFIAELFRSAKRWKRPNPCPLTNECINKTHSGVSLSLKRREILTGYSMMKLEDIMLSEMCQLPKEKYCTIPIT